MGRTVTVFPGQGSQYAGMAKSLVDEFPAAKRVYEEASDALKENLLKLCLEGPDEALQLTKNAQPAILTTSYAWYQVLEAELGYESAGGAGHSLGEYSALLAAGAIGLADAVRLVRTRGELMQNAVPPGKGKMAAVLGLDDELVILLCEKASTADSIVVPANFNAPGQVVIAGNAEAVDRAAKIAAEDPTVKARKLIPLKVSAPFHCPLMEDVANQFSNHLKAISWNILSFPIAFNVDGEIRRQPDCISLLTEQIDSPVKWTTCLKNLHAAYPLPIVEVGPGKVLTGLNKRIVEGAELFSIDNVEDLRTFGRKLKEMSI